MSSAATSDSDGSGDEGFSNGQFILKILFDKLFN